jgi:hypothetical protein
MLRMRWQHLAVMRGFEYAVPPFERTLVALVEDVYARHQYEDVLAVQTGVDHKLDQGVEVATNNVEEHGSEEVDAV